MNPKLKQALIVIGVIVFVALIINLCACEPPRPIVKIYGTPYKQTRVRSCEYPGICCTYGYNTMKRKQPYEYFCGFHNDCDGQETIEEEITPYTWRYADENDIKGNGKESIVTRRLDRCAP